MPLCVAGQEMFDRSYLACEMWWWHIFQYNCERMLSRLPSSRWIAMVASNFSGWHFVVLNRLFKLLNRSTHRSSFQCKTINTSFLSFIHYLYQCIIFRSTKYTSVTKRVDGANRLTNYLLRDYCTNVRMVCVSGPGSFQYKNSLDRAILFQCHKTGFELK